MTEIKKGRRLREKIRSERIEIKNDDLKPLRPVLRKWISLNREYLRICRDLPWRYNERTSVGFLAAAAWKAGGMALEEYSTNKWKGKEGKKGRCDIKIHKSSNVYACEAKQLKCKLNKNINLAEFIGRIRLYFSKAKKDAGDLKTREGTRVGVCFLIPSISKDEEDNLENRLEELVSLLRKRPKTHALAWIFAKHPSQLIPLKGRHKTIRPGIIIRMQVVRKRQGKKAR